MLESTANTDTVPMKLPVVPRTDEEMKELHKRLDQFKEAMDSGKASELVLTADDINALINEKETLPEGCVRDLNPAFREFRRVTYGRRVLTSTALFPIKTAVLCSPGVASAGRQK